MTDKAGLLANRCRAAWLTDKTLESPIKLLLRLANRIRA